MAWRDGCMQHKVVPKFSLFLGMSLIQPDTMTQAGTCMSCAFKQRLVQGQPLKHVKGDQNGIEHLDYIHAEWH
jgi:hypothetical protein